jgi:bifunctional DNA-binding transcriptional regulator/antitoxin component of YhaV-PrlF toxin-antitoxin module
MNATAIRPKRQVTLPAEVCQSAGLRSGDQVEWCVRDGEIRGRKLVPIKRSKPGQLKQELIIVELRSGLRRYYLDRRPIALCPRGEWIRLDSSWTAFVHTMVFCKRGQRSVQTSADGFKILSL